MFTDYRRYGYRDYEPLITRQTQLMEYLNGKFDNIKVSVDSDAIADIVNDKVEGTLANNQSDIDEKFKLISHQIEKAKHEVIGHIKPYCPYSQPKPHDPHHHHHHHDGCHPFDGFATKEDIEAAIEKINSNTNDHFTDLNLDVIREKNHRGY